MAVSPLLLIVESYEGDESFLVKETGEQRAGSKPCPRYVYFSLFQRLSLSSRSPYSSLYWGAFVTFLGVTRSTFHQTQIMQQTQKREIGRDQWKFAMEKRDDLVDASRAKNK